MAPRAEPMVDSESKAGTSKTPCHLQEDPEPLSRSAEKRAQRTDLINQFSFDVPSLEILILMVNMTSYDLQKACYRSIVLQMWNCI